MAIYDNYLPTKDAGNGVTTDFSFSWDMIEEMYSRVYLEEVATGVLTLQTLYTDYTLTLNETGGIVSFVSAPSSDYNIIISREVPLEQIVPFTTSSGFNAKVIEDALDKTTGMIQDLGDSISRTILLPVGSSLTNVSLPQPTAKRGLIWNDTEDGLENTLYNPDEQVLIASASATSASTSATSASASATSASTSATSASTSATSASTSADLSESWAIDDIGDRPEGSSKYWAEQSALSVTGKANTDLDNLSVTGQAVINGKANTNLDNITSNGKETVVGWGMPNYSAGVSKTVSGWVAPTIGWCYWRSGEQCICYVNGQPICQKGIWTNQPDQFFPLSAGDVVTFTGVDSCVFYPIKGVN